MEGRLCKVCIGALSSLLASFWFGPEGVHHHGSQSFEQSAIAGCMICGSALRHLNALEPPLIRDEQSTTKMVKQIGFSNAIRVQYRHGETSRELGTFSISSLKSR